MEAIRTPDERFADLPAFGFEQRYADVDGLRVGYVEEGPSGARPVLLLHGEPTWSYLYRKMIPVLVEAGHRVVAPDLVGFGRSDKPAEQADYTYDRHVAWMRGLLDVLALRDIVVFGQDWGGLIGLRLLAEDPDRFRAAAVSNTGLPTGDQAMSEAFLAWQRFSQETDDFPVGAIVAGGCAVRPPPEVVAAYDAPFPDDRYKAGARRFPMLVPTSPDDPAAPANRAAWEVLSRFEKPFLCAYADSDPITRGADAAFLERVPGTKGQPHTTIEGAGHFVQEDKGPELARVIASWLG